VTDKKPTEASLDDLHDWVTAYREAKANADNWTEIADRAKGQITAALEQAGATVGTVGGHPAVRWTEVDSSRFNTRKFKAEYPDLADQFSIPTTTRRFTLVEDKGGK
jgi:predicted phage-related endonuclease